MTRKERVTCNAHVRNEKCTQIISYTMGDRDSRVVTGEKNSPTAAHAGRKRRLRWLSVPGGVAGPSCPGGYKYGGLALQLGSWATGRQPVTAKQLGNC
jgi:hypothetical protein